MGSGRRFAIGQARCAAIPTRWSSNRWATRSKTRCARRIVAASYSTGPAGYSKIGTPIAAVMIGATTLCGCKGEPDHAAIIYTEAATIFTITSSRGCPYVVADIRKGEAHAGNLHREASERTWPSFPNTVASARVPDATRVAVDSPLEPHHDR